MVHFVVVHFVLIATGFEAVVNFVVILDEGVVEAEFAKNVDAVVVAVVVVAVVVVAVVDVAVVDVAVVDVVVVDIVVDIVVTVGIAEIITENFVAAEDREAISYLHSTLVGAQAPHNLIGRENIA